MNKNPFYTRELPLNAPFCNRVKELDELVSHAQNKMNVVLFSPRRYGKTSLIKRVLDRVSKKGVVPIYADMFGVTSQEDIADRIAKAIYENTSDKKKIFDKLIKWLFSWRPAVKIDDQPGAKFTLDKVAGVKDERLVDEVLEAIDKLSRDTKAGCCVVLDEFQEISGIKNSLAIEGLMRAHIQKHSKTAYVFVGSRRTMLKDMFNEKKRPFYRSATNYELKPLPDLELCEYITSAFAHAKKSCPRIEAEKIVKLVQGYAYYAQKIAYCVFERTEKIAKPEIVEAGIKDFFDTEKPYYEMMLSQLSTLQTKLVTALAKEPTQTPYGNDYIARHKLGSLSAIQGGIKKLISVDYIDRQNGYYDLVDPLFKMWLINTQD